MKSVRFFLILCCFVFSGVSGLIYQIVWTQQFRYLFGSSSMSVVAVLSAYMAGLTLGAWLVPRFLRFIKYPLLTYALLEIGIAITALAVPFAMDFAGDLFVSLFSAADLTQSADSFGASVFYLASCFAILLLPTCFMGATLPLLVSCTVHEDEQIGPRTGLLYTANTLGAASGALLTSFWLLPDFGLHTAVSTAVATNGLVFIFAGCLALLGTSSGTKARPRPVSVRANGPRWILGLILISGAVSFSLEVMWTRLLAHILTGSVYAFGAMLATFLIGIAAGSAVSSRLATSMERARRWFVVVELGVVLFSVLAFVALDFLIELISVAASESEDTSVAIRVALSMVAMFPGTVCIGATFPLAVRILSRSADQAGAATASTMVWNTIGAALGSIATGLFVLPGLGFAGTVAAAGIASLAIAFVASIAGAPRMRFTGAVAAAGIIAILVFPPQTPWSILRSSPMRGKSTEGDVVYYGVGRNSTVILTENVGHLALMNDGLVESVIPPAGTHYGFNACSRWPSMMALALRPQLKSMLVIGLGGGHTIEDIPETVEEVSVVELESKIIEANRSIAHWKGDKKEDSRISILSGDARTALKLTGKKVDSIVSQPSYYWSAGTASIMTEEFFELVKKSLTPDGVFVQWMALPYLDESALRSTLATLGSVFDHVEVYQLYQNHDFGAAAAVCSSKPLKIEETAARAIAVAPEQWRSLGVLSAEDLMMEQVIDELGVAGLADGVELNTDDRNRFRTLTRRALAHSSLDRPTTDKLFGPYDSLYRQWPRTNLAYIIGRLFNHGQFSRALRVAGGIANSEVRKLAFALIEMYSGHARKAEEKLMSVLANNPDETRAFHALLNINLKQIVLGQAPPRLLEIIDSDPSISAVLDGLKLVAEGDLEGIAVLEPELAAVETENLFYDRAQDLRIKWRLASKDPERAEEAIGILDPLLYNEEKAKKMLLRAEIGIAASNFDVAFASLAELGRLCKLSEKRAELKEKRNMDPFGDELDFLFNKSNKSGKCLESEEVEHGLFLIDSIPKGAVKEKWLEDLREKFIDTFETDDAP